MSDVNIDFVVSNNAIDFSVVSNDITITPTDIQLSFNATGAAYAGGSNGTVQFNSGGFFGGSTDFTYNGPNATVSMTNANVGNLIANGNVSLGNVSNVHITGGSNGLFLQTDGNGNLTWSGGSLGPGGPNTSIQFHNGTDFDGSANLTFNPATNLLNINGNITANGNVTANYFVGTATLASLANYATVANSVAGANVSGTVANAAYSTNAGNLTQTVFNTEKISIISAQSGTYNFDILDSSVKYSSPTASANVILNFRGNSSVTANSVIPYSNSVTVSYILTTGANVYSVSSITIDGTSQAISWVSDTVPITLADTKNCYTFTIIKTSSGPTYDVLGSLTRYG